MEESVNTFDLSPEQQDTAALLQRLLGKAIAGRYLDFSRLAAGAFALRVACRACPAGARFYAPENSRSSDGGEGARRPDRARNSCAHAARRRSDSDA